MGSDLAFQPVQTEKSNNQANETAEIARIMNVGDADETRQIRDVMLRGEFLPSGKIGVWAAQKPKTIAQK